MVALESTDHQRVTPTPQNLVKEFLRATDLVYARTSRFRADRPSPD
jgi:hypothetical protein